MKNIKLFAPLSLLVVLALALSACGAGLGQQPTAADVIAKMRETMKTTQTSQGVADLSLTVNKEGLKTLAQGMMGGSTAGMPMMGKNGKDWTAQLPDSASATIKTWKQSPDKLRVEVESSTLPGVKGATIVYDGQKVYVYDPSENIVYTGTPDKLMDRIPDEMKAALDSAMQSADAEKQLDKLIDASDVKLIGTEKVAGYDAYKLDITPKPDFAEKLEIPQMFQMQAGVLLKDLHGTLWVDATRWIPLKVTLEHPNAGSFTAAATELNLNQPIDSAMFVLQIPAGAKTVDLDAKSEKMSPKSTTLTEAKAQAQADGWTLLEPSYVPEGATLIEVTKMGDMMGAKVDSVMGGSAYILNYSSPTTNFSVMESKGEYQKMLGDGFSGRDGGVLEDVPLRGVTAKAFSPEGGNWTALFWQEKNDGIWVAIHGKLSLDEAVKIAEGLK